VDEWKSGDAAQRRVMGRKRIDPLSLMEVMDFPTTVHIDYGIAVLAI
jgi:hypothetical protein